MLYCFHTAGVLHLFMQYNLLGPGISFYRKSKINVKRKPNYEIGWFHNRPMIISHRLYSFHALQTMIFRYDYKIIHYKVYLTALKISKFWFVHFELPFRLKGTEKIHTERFFKFLSNIYSILYVFNPYSVCALNSKAWARFGSLKV